MSRSLVPVVRAVLLSLVALGAAIPAHAQFTYIQTDTTFDSSNPNGNRIIVGYDSTFSVKSNPTVNLVAGGYIGGYLNAYNSSIINISGGIIGQTLDAVDTSNVTISGGSIEGQGASGVTVFVEDNSSLTFVGNNLTLTDKHTTTFGGGEAFDLSGTLADGTDITTGYVLDELPGFSGRVFLQNVSAADTPEPSALAFLYTWIIGAGLALRQRKRLPIGA